MLAKIVYMLIADTDREYHIKCIADRVFIDAVNKVVRLNSVVLSGAIESIVYENVIDVRVDLPSLTVL